MKGRKEVLWFSCLELRGMFEVFGRWIYSIIEGGMPQSQYTPVSPNAENRYMNSATVMHTDKNKRPTPAVLAYA